MKVYFNGKKIHLFPRLMSKIGKGSEGQVYLYKKEALKLYHNPGFQGSSLSLKDALYLKELSTSNILLPNSILTDDKNKIIGYTTTYKEKSTDSIHDLKKEELLSKLRQIKEELDYLSENGVLVNDWININFLYDGSIIFFDPGMYEIASPEEYTKKQIYAHNYQQLRYFILHELIVIEKYPKVYQCKMRESFYKSLLEEYDEKVYHTIIEFLEEKMLSDETLSKYILKK